MLSLSPSAWHGLVGEEPQILCAPEPLWYSGCCIGGGCYWKLNSGPHACHAGAMPLSQIASSMMAFGIRRGVFVFVLSRLTKTI